MDYISRPCPESEGGWERRCNIYSSKLERKQQQVKIIKYISTFYDFIMFLHDIIIDEL